MLNPQTTDRPKTILAAHVLVWQSDKVLVLRRINTSYMNGWYCFPGGHVEPSETASDAAIRETFEESGIHILQKNLQFCGAMHRFASKHELARVELFFSCQKWDGTAAIMEPLRFDDLKWMSPNAPLAQIVPFMADALSATVPGELWYREFDWQRLRDADH